MANLRGPVWVTRLVFLAVAAWLTAGVVNGVLAHGLRELPALDPPRGSADQASQRATPVDSRALIVQRNLFGSALAGPREGEGPALDERRARELLGGDLGPLSPLQASLVGTVVAEPAGWSLALITDTATSETAPYRVGDGLLAQARVVVIRAEYVVLDREGRLEHLVLQEPGGRARPTLPQARAEAGMSPRPIEGVRQTGEGSYAVARASLDGWLTDPRTFARDARIVPAFEGGQPVGFRLMAVRPGSLYEALGVRGNDVVRKVNGHPMNDMEKPLEVYQQLKTARRVEIEIVRGGRPVTLAYDIL